MEQTSNQKRSVEAVVSKIQEYMDLRFQQVARINQSVEKVWDDLTWQQMTRLRASLSTDKSFGAVRHHVAETMLGDDFRMIREFFSTKSQVSLQAELVETRESDANKTHGTMEVHDMRTLCRAIDPTLESIANLIQTFMWWDLEDAADTARCERKLANISALEKQDLTPEMAEAYRKKMNLEETVTNEVAIGHECLILKKTVDSFRLRRSEERGHQVIIARENKPNEDVDRLIEAVASQNNLIRMVKSGGDLDPKVKEQVAKAMHAAPDQLTAEKIAAFMTTTAAHNKARLRQVLVTGGTGDAFNYKMRQLEQLQAKLDKAMEGRNIQEHTKLADPPTG